MTNIPLRGSGYSYRGSNELKRLRTAEKNKLVAKITAHANTKIANDPSEIQMLSFGFIALDLDCDVEIVRYALSNGGYNGLTIRVTPEDRKALAAFKTADKF